MAAGSGHHARPLFLPHRQKFVAARPFNWKGQHLECGDPVPADWPLHHLRHLHTQSLIGPEGHPWTEGRHASWARRLAQGVKRGRAKIERQLDDLEDQAEASDLTAVEAMEAAEEARTLRDRIAGLYGGAGEQDAESGTSDPA